MTLERWSVNRYQLPRLDIQAIRRRDDVLEVDSRRGVFQLACDDVASCERELLPMLDSLRDPRSTLWRAVRDGADGTDELIAMLRELDQLGLIRDGSMADVSRTHAAIDRTVRAWSAELGRELAAGPAQAIEAMEAIAGRLAAPDVPRGAIFEEPNFFVATLLLQARYLRTYVPSVLAVFVAGLRAAVRFARGGEASAWWSGVGEMPQAADEEWSSGLVGVRVVRRYLTAARRLLHDAMAPDAARRIPARRDPVEPLSGINFMIDLEAEMPRILEALGPCPAVAAISEPDLARNVITSAFLQEYLVTCRFAECVAPLLSRRFPEPLRDAVERYFAEETGHEAFERDYCVRLGVTEQAIDAAEPLPLYLAFVDILIALANESPISWFCALMFTRGVIRTRHMLARLVMQAMPDEELLFEAIGDPLSAGEDPEHRGIGRDWMSNVPLVTTTAQREIGDLIAYLAELNWRSWDQLLRAADPRSSSSRADRAAG